MFKFWKKDKEKSNIEEVVEAVIEEELDSPSDVDLTLEDENTKKNLVEESIESDLVEKDKSDEDLDSINGCLSEYAQSIKEETTILDSNLDVETVVEDNLIVSEVIDNDIEDSIVEEDTNVVDETKEEDKKLGIFAKLMAGLTKTKENITGRIDSILKSYTKIDEDLLEDLEEVLITADVGFNTTVEIIDRLRDDIKSKGVKDPSEVRGLLKNIVEDILSEDSDGIDFQKTPTIIVMVGVNGVGKTTTIGKIAQKYKDKNKKVILAAADTFRAAATEQLDIWAKRVGVDIIKHHEGADPGAVIFDAIKAAQARKADVLICDTAGRLHNKTNLMNELGKIFKIIDREYPEAHREVLLVVDATTGQNAVSQAKTFKEVANITGIVLTKLDGTAKGGVVLAVKSEVDVPVKLIGVGEKVEDLQDFNAKSFSDALFGE